MARSLDGKVALVTGAGSGIGRASALLFAREGAHVVSADRDGDAARATVDQVVESGGSAHAVVVDVTDEDQVSAMVREAVDTFGRLDCAHNNAGIFGGLTRTADLDADVFRKIVEVDLVGVFLCLKHEIPAMLATGGGAIVNTSSGAGLGGVPYAPGYAASKHGVIGLTRSTAAEYAREGIRVNAVCPGPIDTPMLDDATAGNEQVRQMFSSAVPMAREGTPEEVAELVVWLCSDAASYVTGAAATVDGGATAI